MKKLVYLLVLITTAAVAAPGRNDLKMAERDPAKAKMSKQDRLDELEASIWALHPGGKLNPAWIRKIAIAALRAEKATGVDATFLVAVGRQESDFRPLQSFFPGCYKGGRNCWADCGWTQHHIRGWTAWVRRRCAQLAKDANQAALLSAKEIAHHIRWCKKWRRYQKPLYRCVLNRYNQGPYYRTQQKCWARHKCWQLRGETKVAWKLRRPKCLRKLWPCLRKAGYWTNVMCFLHGARRYLHAKHDCRRCLKIKRIPGYYPSTS